MATRNHLYSRRCAVLAIAISFSAVIYASPPARVPRNTTPQMNLDQCIQREVKFVLQDRMARVFVVGGPEAARHVRWEIRADYQGIAKVQLIKKTGTPINLVGELAPGKATFDIIARGESYLEGGLAELHVWGNPGCGEKDLYFKYQIRMPRVASATSG